VNRRGTIGFDTLPYKNPEIIRPHNFGDAGKTQLVEVNHVTGKEGAEAFMPNMNKALASDEALHGRCCTWLKMC